MAEDVVHHVAEDVVHEEGADFHSPEVEGHPHILVAGVVDLRSQVAAEPGRTAVVRVAGHRQDS